MKTNEEMLKALESLLVIDSVCRPGEGGKPFGIGADKALETALALCADLGFKTKNCDGKIGWAEIGEGDEMIGILAHLDVVPEGSGWEYPAFGCTVVDGKVYGRGTSDDKGPAVTAIFAMKDLLDSGKKLNRRIRIIFGLSEEVGDWPDMEYYKQTEELPVFGFTPDASFPALYGEKGIADFSVTMPLEKSGFESVFGGQAVNMVPDAACAVVNGKTYSAEGKSAHGSTPAEGINAISKLMHELCQLPDAPFAAKVYDELIGFNCDASGMDCNLCDEQSGALTHNVGVVKSENGVFEMLFDIRYPVTKSLEEVKTRLEKALCPHGFDVKCYTHKAPVYMDKNGPVIKALMSAYRDETGDNETEPAVIGGGTYARAMDNIVAFGPGLPGREGTEHQKNEYVLLEDFYLARKIYRTALERLLEI